jgi:hypothetical protein
MTLPSLSFPLSSRLDQQPNPKQILLPLSNFLLTLPMVSCDGATAGVRVCCRGGEIARGVGGHERVLQRGT